MAKLIDQLASGHFDSERGQWLGQHVGGKDGVTPEPSREVCQWLWVVYVEGVPVCTAAARAPRMPSPPVLCFSASVFGAVL